eukprot:155728_1
MKVQHFHMEQVRHLAASEMQMKNALNKLTLDSKDHNQYLIINKRNSRWSVGNNIMEWHDNKSDAGGIDDKKLDDKRMKKWGWCKGDKHLEVPQEIKEEYMQYKKYKNLGIIKDN